MSLNSKIIEDIKKTNSWFIPFNLSDQELYDVDVCGSRVRAGSDNSADLISNLRKSLLKQSPETINQIALAIAINQLWPMRKYIKGDVESFIKSLGGTPPVKKKKIKKKKPSEKTPKDYLIKAETAGSQNSSPTVITDNSKSMTFSTMDEEELKKIAVPEAETYKLDYDSLADDIISKFGYNESDEILHKRLSNIIISRFRDVRDEIESIEALTKSQKIGGMEFTKEQATELLGLIKKEQETFKEYHISGGDAIQRIEFKPKIPQFEKAEVKVKTLQEKRAEEMRRQGTNSSVSVSVEPIPIVSPQAELSKQAVPPTLPEIKNVPVAPKQPEVAKIDSFDSQNKITAEVSPAPIMDEEDGLPILRMPEDLMVKPKIVKLDDIGEEKKEEAKKPVPINIPPASLISEKKLESNDDIIEASLKNNLVNNFVEEKSIPVSVPVSLKQSESAPLPRPAPYVVQKNIPQRVLESQNTRRPIVDGIKLAKKLTGPIEELSDMTLIDFRRLASNPVEATRSIREKIKLLQEESYARRIEGINAWFGNEVNRFYRLLGQTSMTEGRSIDDIIKERLVSGKPTLSLEEFDAVMQLNSELRY
ncbi:MAG: hypothetical protein WC244_00825 [Patescibacteria group bacterium]|jgi:hypothetical protein